MKRLVLLLAACGASAKETPTHRPPDDDRHLTTAGYCAPIEELGPFAHELFPACPAPPLRYKVRLCGEQPCASPCRYAWSVTGAAVEEASGEERYTYDAEGRLATVIRDGVTRTCAYDAGGRIVESCLGDPVDARRAENGRLIAIGPLDLRYDDNGRVIAIGHDELSYDTTGRIATYASRRLEWDGLMLAAEHFGDDGSPMRYRYDAKGFLVKVEDDESSTALTYEGNRLVSVVSTAKDERRESTFTYACN